MEQSGDDKRVGVVGVGSFFINVLLDEVVEVVLDEVFVEDLEAVEEVEQEDEIPVQLHLAKSCHSLYHEFLCVLLDGLVDLHAVYVDVVGREDVEAFAELDHLADVVVDCLVPLVGLELFGQGLVEVDCSLVVAKDEEVVCDFTCLCFLYAVRSFNRCAAFEEVDEPVLGGVDLFVSSAELSEPDLDVLLDLYSLIVDDCPERYFLIISNQLYLIGRLQFVLNINDGPRVIAPQRHIMRLLAIELNDASERHIQLVIVPQGLKLFLGIIVGNLILGIVEDDDQQGDVLGPLRVEREHLLYLHLRLLLDLLVLALDVGVAVDLYQEGEAERLLERADLVVLLVQGHEVEEQPACVFEPVEIQTPQKVLRQFLVNKILPCEIPRRLQFVIGADSLPQ